MFCGILINFSYEPVINLLLVCFPLHHITMYDACRGVNGELRVGVRRAMRQQANVPSSVISSHSMHLGVLATAWHAVNTGTMFTVYYKPRLVLNPIGFSWE